MSIQIIAERKEIKYVWQLLFEVFTWCGNAFSPILLFLLTIFSQKVLFLIANTTKTWSLPTFAFLITLVPLIIPKPSSYYAVDFVVYQTIGPSKSTVYSLFFQKCFHSCQSISYIQFPVISPWWFLSLYPRLPILLSSVGLWTFSIEIAQNYCIFYFKTFDCGKYSREEISIATWLWEVGNLPALRLSYVFHSIY